MKPKFYFLGIAFLVLFGLAIFGYFGAVSGGRGVRDAPQIKVEPEFFDFGSVKYGAKLEHSFKIINSGRGVLRIKRVVASCACTKGEVAEKEIRPGGTSRLKVTYDTGAMSGPYGRGEQQRIVYIKSNDPINPQVEVVIYANVK